MDWKKKTFSRRDILFGFKGKFRQTDTRGAGTGSGFRAREIDALLAAEEYETAAAELQDVLDKSPDHLQARKNLGFCLFRTRRFQQAEAQLKTVLQSEVNDHFSLLYLGLVLVGQGRIAEAVSWWRGYFNPDQPIINRAVNLQITLFDMGSIGSQEEIEMSLETAIKEQKGSDAV